MMQQQVYLTGAKYFKGDVEGKPYDSTTLFCLLSLDTSQGTAVGKASAEYKFGTSDNFAMVKNLLRNGPVSVTLEMEQVTTGKATKTIVTGIKPAQETK